MNTESDGLLLDIDYVALRRQKRVLLNTIAVAEGYTGTKAQAETLTGLVHLIDSIQDWAVSKDGGGLSEEWVFGLSNRALVARDRNRQEDNLVSANNDENDTFFWEDDDEWEVITHEDGRREVQVVWELGLYRCGDDADEEEG